MLQKLKGLVTKLYTMRLLKIITVTSFLFINGLGPHGIPNFAGIPLCLYQFTIDIFNSFSHKYEISWLLGLVGVSTIGAISIVLFSKQYKDRYLVAVALSILLCSEIFLSAVLHHHKLIFWFIFPFLVFIASSIALLLKSFRDKKEITHANI